MVSLNWDTALERAYRRLCGTSLPSGILFKPHNDASSPVESWILPHEPAQRYAIGVLGLGSLLLTQLRYEHGDLIEEQQTGVENQREGEG